MSGYTARPIQDAEQEDWHRLLSEHLMARCIVPVWEVLAGWKNLNVGLFDRGGALVGGLVLSIRKMPVVPLFLSRINVVMIGPEDTLEMLEELFAFVDRYAVKNVLVETELRLRIPATGVEGFEQHKEIRASLEGLGYRALAHADNTYFIDLDRDDKALQGAFKSEYRNRIRKARKLGVEVITSKDPALLDAFADAYLDMCRRKGAPEVPRALVGRGLGPLVDRGHVMMFLERYGDQIANMLIVDTLGVPIYSLGTRFPGHVSGQVPGAAQVLHFEIMRALRERGHRYYDLGGCEGPVPIEGHPNYGVWRFKYGFRPQFVRFIPYMRKIRGPAKGVMNFTHRMRGDFI